MSIPDLSSFLSEDERKKVHMSIINRKMPVNYFVHLFETKTISRIVDYIKKEHGDWLTSLQVAKVLHKMDYDELEKTFYMKDESLGLTFTTEETLKLTTQTMITQLHSFCRIYECEMFSPVENVTTIIFEESPFKLYNRIFEYFILNPLDGNMLCILPAVLHEYRSEECE
jgi:hypothetical protein